MLQGDVPVSRQHRFEVARERVGEIEREHQIQEGLIMLPDPQQNLHRPLRGRHPANANLAGPNAGESMLIDYGLFASEMQQLGSIRRTQCGREGRKQALRLRIRQGQDKTPPSFIDGLQRDQLAPVGLAEALNVVDKDGR